MVADIEDSKSCVRRANFRHGGIMARIVVRRVTHAPWIQDRRAVGQHDEVLPMAMTAMYHAGLDTA